MKTNFLRYSAFTIALLLAVGCTRQAEDFTAANNEQEGPAVGTVKNLNDVLNQEPTTEGEFTGKTNVLTATETFEAGSKTSYANANVTLGTGSWFMSDALIGTSTSDAKTGAKSARLRNYGEIGNNTPFNGVGAVTISAAAYAGDAASTLELWVSTDGTNYSKVGNSVNISSTTLAAYTFQVGINGPVYLDIYKADGTTSRMNIDDVKVYSFGDNGSGSTGGGSTGGGTVGGPATRDNNLALGNPSGATTSTTNPNNYLSVKDQYVISYNNGKGTPNWSSWHLSTAWLGSQSRQNDFRADLSLPSTFYRPDETTYSGSGFDRGHMCPSADRTGSATDNSATFLMSNMVPQAPNNNQRVWADLENYCRTLANAGNELYIISGPAGQGGNGSNGGTTNTLQGGKITVPSSTWKVIVVLPIGTGDVSRVTTSTRVIAVNVPNTQAANNQPWGNYRTTVRNIESLTGYNFLSNVSSTVQNTIETRIDNGPTL